MTHSRNDRGGLHRVWQGLLNLPAPVSIEDVAICVSPDGVPRSYEMAKVTISRLRHLHPKVQIRHVRNKGFVVEERTTDRCRCCRNQVQAVTADHYNKLRSEQLRVASRFCIACFKAYRMGLNDAARGRDLRTRRVKVTWEGRIRKGGGLEHGSMASHGEWPATPKTWGEGAILEGPLGPQASSGSGQRDWPATGVQERAWGQN